MIYVPAVEGDTGRESAGVARPSRAAQMIDGSIVIEHAVDFVQASILLRCDFGIAFRMSDNKMNEATTSGRARVFCTNCQRVRHETCTMA